MDKAAWPLGLSCERTTLAFWAEPINALTALTCFFVSWVCWREWKSTGGDDKSALVYVVMNGVVGATAFGMHTIPSPLLSLVDTVVTAGFILMALFGLFHRHLQMKTVLALIGSAAFVAVAPFVADFAKAILSRDSALFVPVLFIFPLAGALMVFHGEKLHPVLRERQLACARLLMLGSVIFMVGLAARALDRPFCGRFPTGLHFIWHVAFAVSLGLVTIAYIRNRPVRS